MAGHAAHDHKAAMRFATAADGLVEGAQHAEEIGIELTPVVSERQLLRLADDPEARVGDDDAGHDALRRKLRDHACDVTIHGDIAAVRARLPPAPAQLRRQRLQLLVAPRHQRHANPRRANSRASPAPIPEEAPVIRTVVLAADADMARHCITRPASAPKVSLTG